MVLLDVRDLKTYFYTRTGIVKAVDGVSFQVKEGETLGLVGESGCGKSITSLSILRLVPQPAGKIVGGQILYNGEDLLTKSEKEMRSYRGKHLSMILQDPMISLNPVLNIGYQVGEGIVIHRRLKEKELQQNIIEVMKDVRIPSPANRLIDFPHQYSGGMRQRVVGAISIACHPKLLIADEPTTSLDVTTQMAYLNLLLKIQQEKNLSMIFITHNLGIVSKMCNRVAVMYAGKIVEMAEVRDLFDNTLHPYSRALIGSIPKVEEKVERLFNIEGKPPRPANLPPGCAFLPRCTEKIDCCNSEEFPPEVRNGNGNLVRCWKYV